VHNIIRKKFPEIPFALYCNNTHCYCQGWVSASRNLFQACQRSKPVLTSLNRQKLCLNRCKLKSTKYHTYTTSKRRHKHLQFQVVDRLPAVVHCQLAPLPPANLLTMHHTQPSHCTTSHHHILFNCSSHNGITHIPFTSL